MNEIVWLRFSPSFYDNLKASPQAQIHNGTANGSSDSVGDDVVKRKEIRKKKG
jgi:hypothetical protein